MVTIDTSQAKDSAVAQLDPVLLAELIRLASILRTKRPDEVASQDVLRSRREFLRESIGETQEADDVFERIIGGNELQPISYLERGAIAARAVARIDLGGQGYGTGFLIAPRVLITNNHVLPDAASAAQARAQFSYELDLSDTERGPVNYRVLPDELFFTQKNLDFTIVAVEATSADNATALSTFGCLPLVETTGKVSEGEWLTIIQHADGARKQVCVRENQFIKRDNDVLWYSTDTNPGSSGSPVFNNDWFVVALHHAGVPEKRNGVVQSNPDGSTKWIGNEGIRVSRIVQTLKEAHRQHPLLLPLFAATPATARITGPSLLSPTTMTPPRETRMADARTISIPLEVRLQVQADGRLGPVSVTTPQGTEATGMVGAGLLEKKKKPDASFDAPFDDDYSRRKGFDPDFLGAPPLRVGFPVLGDALEAVAAPLLKPKDGNKFLLHYHNYSVVVHKQRRLPIYSAANVSFGDRFEMSRPPDVWRRDPRILAEHQLENWYYASNNFDRGHMTRREDLEFGKSPRAALASAADTLHWANCVPQHARFNQNKEIWQGIERYILERSILEGEVNAQVITGPVLDDGDPEYRKVKYPLQFWKVVAAVTPKKELFATAYIAGQEEVIAQFGIEITEVPFGEYKTFQTRISEIERLTGLAFVGGAGGAKRLSEFDPLENAPAGRRRRRPRPQESTGRPLPNEYYEIAELDDIQL
ncbi:DNA/RNA non-specific endonuclease [Reyranella sp.]|uniref:DNA/RNA non-specific endonuclease n=1 Tax=Reyranella sp. TaxID=1929291 RepID=UPI003D0A2183